MEVICIDDKWECEPSGNEPNVGEIVTATQSIYYEDSYFIQEYLFDDLGHNQSFAKYHFIPLSDIDETQMERNYQTVEIINHQ